MADGLRIEDHSGDEDRDSTEPGSVDLSEFGRVWSLISKRLGDAAKRDPALADACGVVGRWLIALVDPVRDAPATDAPVAESPDESPGVEPEQRTVERTLSLGGDAAPVEVVDDGTVPTAVAATPTIEPAPPEAWTSPPVVPLALVAQRAQLKAECCRWAIDRRGRLADGADFEQHIKPMDIELYDRLGSLPECYAWPLDPYVTLPGDLALENAGGCYEALADAIELAERVRSDEELFDSFGHTAYELLAECCSSLRIALDRCDIRKDADQTAAFNWLRVRTHEDGVFIARHMRLEDPADPETWPDRRDVVAGVVEQIDALKSHEKERKNLLGRVGYLAKRWADYQGDEVMTQTTKLADAIERLVELKVRPSDPRIRDPLLTIADDLPDGFEPRGPFAEALRYADEHTARLEAESQRPPATTAEPTAEVLEARALLKGKVVVLIGGDCRPRSRDALREGLELAELRWVATREHESISNFESQVKRDDVAVVLLAIRWASHSFEGIKTACDRAGKPFVRLPGGYGLNRVAYEIVNQVSDELDKG